ncbi:HesA/MoeB/ThiF family protein [Paludibaculum fermentans]|uniref:HesA/MoeB/ThiF family protein n=1 Tax=Paludibaculum fermentans TaxID=1473598 RepID=UPI003EC09E1E
MHPAFTDSPTSVELAGTAIPGAEDRQKRIAGFDQAVFSKSRVLCVGAGGLVSQIAPTLCRKGIGEIVLLDGDWVEPSNLNRQRFYTKDLWRNKAVALAKNLQPECIAATRIRGHALSLEAAIEQGIDLSCGIAICGVDNNPTRVAASRHFRAQGVPVVFTAVSASGDHGYVFVQDNQGSCLGCLYPDMGNDNRYPCPGTPAIADILQVVGGLVVYAVDTLLTQRKRSWNYRRISLASGELDAATMIPSRTTCSICASHTV